MKKQLPLSILATVLTMLVALPVSAQGGLQIDPSMVTLEPGQNYAAAKVGSIRNLATGVYLLTYSQTGSVALQNLQMFVNGLKIDSGSTFVFSSSATLGLSFFVRSDASPGHCAVISVALYDILGRLVGRDTLEVCVQFESVSRLVCLRAYDGVHHVVSEANGKTVNADRPWCRAFEVHRLFDINGEELMDGDSVAILAWHGRYWSAQSGGELYANLPAAGPTEVFELHKLSGDQAFPVTHNDVIALKTAHDRWVVAERGGGDVVRANRPIQSIWETFRFLPGVKHTACFQAHNSEFVGSEDDKKSVNANRNFCGHRARHELTDINGGELRSGDVVYVRSNEDRFWSAQPGGELEANRINAGPWERFKLLKLSGSPGEPIEPGDEVALETIHGKYVVAEGGGGREVAANRDQALAWETFVFMPQ